MLPFSTWLLQHNVNTMPSTALALQAEAHVLRVLYEALHQASTANSPISQNPNTWLPQSTANTELFEVKLNSLEARPLVQAVQAAGVTVVKACTLPSAFCTLRSAHQHPHCSSCYVEKKERKRLRLLVSI